jgi:hypothetical protein
MCFLQYENPKSNYWGCISKELPKDPSTESSSAIADGWSYDDKVPKYCSTNPNCIGYYNAPTWNIATDIDPSKCTETSTDKGYTNFAYKQKVA